MRRRIFVALCFVFAGGVVVLPCSCKKDAGNAETNGRQNGAASVAARPALEVDWKRVRNDMQEWYGTADIDGVWLKGFEDQGFLISKSRIVVVDDGETVRFAADPRQKKEGIFFLMPQNEWFANLDEAVESMELIYMNRKGYIRKEFTATSVEEILTGDR